MRLRALPLGWRTCLRAWRRAARRRAWIAAKAFLLRTWKVKAAPSWVWRFEEAVIKARTTTTCMGRKSVQSRRGSEWDVFELRRGLTRDDQGAMGMRTGTQAPAETSTDRGSRRLQSEGTGERERKRKTAPRPKEDDGMQDGCARE